MIIIYQTLIKNFIETLSFEQFQLYLKKYNYIISTQEQVILYQFIKKHYIDLLNKNENVFAVVKDNLSKETYQKIRELYLKAKEKYL